MILLNLKCGIFEEEGCWWSDGLHFNFLNSSVFTSGNTSCRFSMPYDVCKIKRNLLEDHDVRWQLSRVPRMQMALSQCSWDEWVNGQEPLAFIEGMNTTVLLTQLWNSINGWPGGTFYRYNLLLIQLTGQLLIRRQGINEAKDLCWMPLGASYLCSVPRLHPPPITFASCHTQGMLFVTPRPRKETVSRFAQAQYHSGGRKLLASTL